MKINTLPHEVLLEACVSNGVSRDEFIERGDRIERLELMLTGLPQIVTAVKHFVGLTELVVIGHPGVRRSLLPPTFHSGSNAYVHVSLSVASAAAITSMAGLAGLTQLERLWFCETSIDRISELDSCVKSVFLLRFHPSFYTCLLNSSSSVLPLCISSLINIPGKPDPRRGNPC